MEKLRKLSKYVPVGGSRGGAPRTRQWKQANFLKLSWIMWVFFIYKANFNNNRGAPGGLLGIINNSKRN